MPELSPHALNTLDLLRPFFEDALDAVVVTNGDRRVLYCNRAFQVFCGKSPRALGQAIADSIRCCDLLTTEICEGSCAAERAERLGIAVHVQDVPARRTDGEEMTVIVSAMPVPGLGVIEVFRDVTAEQRIHLRYKELLKKERASKELLAAAVDERTRELRQANKKLKNAQTQLVHSEKMSSLGQLVAGIAHEINNPVNFIRANIGFLKEYFAAMREIITLLRKLQRKDAEARRALKEAWDRLEMDYLLEDMDPLLRALEAGGERTSHIIDDLKNFSRMGESTFRETDLHEGIETTISLLKPLLKDHIVVERAYADPRFTVRCNPGHINQVFMNLLTNAAQAIDGKGTITIVTRLEDDRAVFEVHDTGPGIPEGIKDKLFDPFFTTKPVGKGTGLGLSISYNIVQEHKGTLELKSGPHGAVATVILPHGRIKP